MRVAALGAIVHRQRRACDATPATAAIDDAG